MDNSHLERRNFLKLGGITASAGTLLFNAQDRADSSRKVSPPTKFPKLAIITEYSLQKLQFAASAGYEGVVLKVEDSFDPDKLSDRQVEQVTTDVSQAGVTLL